MNIFTRKPRLAHRLVSSMSDHRGIVYQCSLCHRTFYSVSSASWKHKREWCPGKHCYEDNFLDLPAYLIRGDQLKQERRALYKGQEPIAYLCFTLMGREGREPQTYYALYDIRECIALPGAVELPAFD